MVVVVTGTVVVVVVVGAVVVVVGVDVDSCPMHPEIIMTPIKSRISDFPIIRFSLINY